MASTQKMTDNLPITESLQRLRRELETELENILSYWMKYDTDSQYGGFIGRIDYYNQADTDADKGSVLNSRILWSFSAAYRATNNSVYLRYAQRAYDYFINHFIDKKHGGVYWSVNYKGLAAEKKKQVYAQSFAIYSLSEFFRASGLAAARQYAIDLFMVTEQYSYDAARGGYIDAFAEDWTVLPDQRLSKKDSNEKKTMNTHLHILEAYSNLYRIWPQEQLKIKIKNLLQYFFDYFIDAETGHLVLFFNEDWVPKSTLISYGHDIEAAWLLQEAAETINDSSLLVRTKTIAVKMVEAAREGLDTDGGLWYEYEPVHHHLIKEKHWWPQAEAMVGFFNAWQVAGQPAHLDAARNSWAFVKARIRDSTHGEWVWGVHDGYAVMDNEDRVGPWKCPYHNSRACLELIKRIQTIGLSPA